LHAGAEETPSVTPYRPTVSNPAELSAPGWLELEMGWKREKNDETNTTVPYLLKYAFTPDWGLLIGGDAYVRNVDAQGKVLSGFGETEFLVKHRIPINHIATGGVELGVRAPTAKKGLGSDKADYLVNAILSLDVPALHVDINAGPNWLGVHDTGTGRDELDWSIAASRTVGRWNLDAEFSGAHRSGVPDASQFLVAAAYGFSPRLVVDFGSAFGLGQEHRRSVFAGATVLLGRLH
jgi:hypothetical protein